MRMRKKPNLAARLEKCAHLIVESPEPLRGCWLDEYRYGELHLEIGCGKGRFTVETAKSYPNVLLIALEKLADAMIIALENAAAEEIKNVRFMNTDAENLADFFAPGEVSRIYINFCDPWPANRHAKRRLTSRRFLEIYKKMLRQSGEIHLKTDNLALFEYSLAEFERGGFTILEESRDLHGKGSAGIMTDYEMKFHKMGQPICFCIAK